MKGNTGSPAKQTLRILHEQIELIYRTSEFLDQLNLVRLPLMAL